MKRTKVKIQIQNAGLLSDEKVIMLSDALVKKWKLSTQSSVHLRFGSVKLEVRIVPISQTGILRINDSIAAKCGLSHGDSLCINFKAATRTLHIGPLIGVLISRVYPGADEKPFGAITSFCRELNDACKIYGASVFFFTPDECTQGDTLRGWHYSGKWVKGSFPVPNIIYNRLTARKLENRTNVQQFIRHAKNQYQSLLFNEKYLNKTEVFDALRKETGLHIYLPESYLLRNFQMLKSMCTKYSTVFLKPITGSLGKGIIRIKRQPDNSYVCHFTNVNGARKQTFASLSSMFSSLSGKIKQQRHQIQQGLNLISIGGRPVDFRALVQRDDTGQWGITSIVARIAGNHHFVSNLARGGSLSPVKEALARSNFPGGDGNMKLRRASLAIAKGIETQIPGHFAELGIDLALDTQGRVWLLEVNSKPSKDDNTPLAGNESKIRPSVKKLVQYSRFAAKF